MKKIIAICLVTIVLILGVTCLKAFLDVKSRVTLDLDYTESTDTIQNPERGWFLIYRCRVSDSPSDEKSFYNSFSEQHKSGDSLALLMFNLHEYRDRDISEEGLLYIGNVLQNVRQTGLKAIVRFVYDWDGNGIENEPGSINIIKNHMKQLKVPLIKNQDIIYLVQGVFVGSYGEMHTSKYLGVEDMSTLMNKLLECTFPTTKLAVRTPAYWRTFNHSKEPIRNFTQWPGSRIGLYNDGLCSSDIDLGTYSDGTETEVQKYSNKWLRREELKFQSTLCQFVPNGGELAIESEYNDLENILKEFSLLHISYLNRDYNMEVLEKWRASKYSSNKENEPYNGINGYKYVQDHLGYRFVLRGVSSNRGTFLRTTPTIEVDIENTGFSNLYYQKDVELILRGKSLGDEIRIHIETDVRMWRPGTNTKLQVFVPTKKLKEDTYKMYLRIYEESGPVIQLANSNIFDKELNANAIGELHLKNISFKNIWK